MKTNYFVAGLCLMLSTSACSKDVSDFHIIPFPEHISPGQGEFRFTEDVEIYLSEPASEELQALGDVEVGARSDDLRRVGRHARTVAGRAPAPAGSRLTRAGRAPMLVPCASPSPR